MTKEQEYLEARAQEVAFLHAVRVDAESTGDYEQSFADLWARRWSVNTDQGESNTMGEALATIAAYSCETEDAALISLLLAVRFQRGDHDEVLICAAQAIEEGYNDTNSQSDDREAMSFWMCWELMRDLERALQE